MLDGPGENKLPKGEQETPSDDEHGREDLLRRDSEPADTSHGELERDWPIPEQSDEENSDSEIVELPDGSSVGKAQIQAMVSTHSGPLPAVQDLSGYESVLPGSADRIIKMAETALDTRRQSAMADAEVQKAVARSIDNRGVLERRQQFTFALVTLLALVGTFFLAWNGKTVPSIFALIVAAAGGVVTYKVSQDGFKIYPATGQSEEDE